MTEENPYLTMPSEQFKTHITQIVEALETQKITTLQAFGESLSEDTQNKVTEHASLTEEVKTLTTAVATAKSADKLSPETEKLVKISMDGVISEIKAIDEHFPIEKIVDSSLNEFEKLDMLTASKAGAEYHMKAIDAIKEQVGATSTTKVQGFGKPDETTDIDTLTEKLMKDSGIKFD